MKSLEILYKIQELEKYTDFSLGFQRYTDNWEVSSFKDGTLFNISGKKPNFVNKHLTAKTFEEAVDQAFQKMVDEKRAKAKEIGIDLCPECATPLTVEADATFCRGCGYTEA